MAGVTYPNYLFYEKQNGVDVPLQTLGAYGNWAGAAANQALVTAVTGKVIRVVALLIQSAAAAATYVTLKNGNGGAARFTINAPSNAVAGTPPLDLNPAGWCETDSGVGLYGDVGAGAGVYITIRYVLLSPFTS